MSRRPVGSIHWRSEGVARVSLQHGHDPVTGKPRRMSRTVHGTELDAERALAQMLLDIGEMPTGKSLTFGEFYELLYKPRLEKSKLRIETRQGYFRKIENYVLPRFKHVKMAAIEPYAVED